MSEGPTPQSPPADVKPGTCPNCGGPMRHRSDKDHRMYWPIVRRAFESWPRDHRFQPDSEEHLHGWMLIETGHRECVEVETNDVGTAKAIARGIFDVTRRQIHCMRVFDAGSNGIRICVPGPFGYEAAGKQKYEAVRSAVYEIIEVTLGVKIEELKRASKAGIA